MSKFTNVNFKNANFKGANLTNIRLENTDLSEASFENIIIDPHTKETLPLNIIEKYGHTFQISYVAEELSSIRKAIYFEPEHRQAGIGILSYFSNILDKTYPDSDIRFRIEQNYPLISLVIEAPDGDLIEK